MKPLLAALLATGLAAAAGIAAADPGITVYTWTDAAGVTHFSDKAPANGTARTLTLPTPAPPDRTAQAANAAWLAQAERDTQQLRLAREAAKRRTEEQAAAQAAQAQPYPQYVPVYIGYGHRGWRHSRRWNDHDRDDFHNRPLPPIASFPQYQLPSSFPENQGLPPLQNGGR